MYKNLYLQTQRRWLYDFSIVRMMLGRVSGRTLHETYRSKKTERLLTYAEHCNLLKTIGDRNMKCISEMKLVKPCWIMLFTLRVTSMYDVEKQTGELRVHG